MKIGMCMFLWTTSVGPEHEALLADIRETGFDGVEIPVFEGEPEDYAKLGELLDSLDLEYGTLVPMHFMSREHDMKVVSVAAFCTVHDHDESRVIGEAIRAAVDASDSKVLLLASGSLSHKIWSNKEYAPNNGTFTISSEFNRQVDLMVLDMWKRGDHATFLKILGDYANHCSGEGSMHDTAMLYGALGWDSYTEQCEIVTDYFPSSGTGQVNVIFPVP